MKTCGLVEKGTTSRSTNQGQITECPFALGNDGIEDVINLIGPCRCNLLQTSVLYLSVVTFALMLQHQKYMLA